MNGTTSAGFTVWFTGMSGAGKSTAVALLERLYEPDAGRIRLFGHDLREFDTEMLRSLLAGSGAPRDFLTDGQCAGQHCLWPSRRR